MFVVVKKFEIVANEQEYANWSAEDAIRHYLARVNAKIPHFETMEEKELDYIKVCNMKLSMAVLSSLDDRCWRKIYYQ
jgi:hypothetical protein